MRSEVVVEDTGEESVRLDAEGGRAILERGGESLGSLGSGSMMSFLPWLASICLGDPAIILIMPSVCCLGR